MVKRVVIHIGVHKTGSTAIQEYLWSNAAELLSHGILYPTSGRPTQNGLHYGHHFLPWHLMGRRVPSPIPALIREIEHSDANLILISSEEFDVLQSHQIAPLIGALNESGIITDVIMYFRKQSDVVQGLYGTDIVWNQERRSIQEYAKNFRPTIDYLRLATQWKEAIGSGEVIARPYGSEISMHGIVSDFLMSVGTRMPINKDKVEKNTSLPWYAAKTIQHMWRLGFPNRVIYSTIPTITAICRGASSRYEFLSPRERWDLDRKYTESNREFMRMFGLSSSVLDSAETAPDDSEWREARSGSFAALRHMLNQLAIYVTSAEARNAAHHQSNSLEK